MELLNRLGGAKIDTLNRARARRLIDFEDITTCAIDHWLRISWN